MRMRMMIGIERHFGLAVHCLMAPLSWEVARNRRGSQRLRVWFANYVVV